ncbi:type II toxin-antitoxin system RelE/ParE family toxin [Chitinimonas arctica]|uniref:Type II toxin-antitoxin system RelE/ParE family toxin n=1 Tax=Chitinimonas arctica TaxID=2594795 RepID=A0A516SHE2_9NEIS|nr:type II toxin-antitoxin system RelE/ParE family toxin [Chitinimonas arctica]QDQ27458.1 type II toxin-antitoxin system RelE/ParE family toxin [Chitinimonas arctica]
MAFRVVLLAAAEQDLRKLKNYLVKNFGRHAWEASYGKIKDATNSLKAFPLKGAIPDELERLNLMQYRQLIAGMNRIIYEIDKETIFIHLICDTRKDLKSLLLERILRVI